tara:strand:- start:300 stop:500 length:201 start_codon:yes stop_codon:yes gene_type:complete
MTKIFEQSSTHNISWWNKTVGSVDEMSRQETKDFDDQFRKGASNTRTVSSEWDREFEKFLDDWKNE